jgi:aspartate kinase
MKFGGTSVGDASCIARVAKIVAEASRETAVVTVVSAMSGVSNLLMEAAARAEAGDRDQVGVLLDALRKQHDIALAAMIRNKEERGRLASRMEEVFGEGQRLCERTMLLHELTPRTLDSISSLGERLSAPLVAGALRELGVRSEAIEATELITTDSYHSAAEPFMDLTREHSQARLRPLLDQGIVPVVTGFIGATPEGVLTTIGRGGSDYSAMILGAALDANEIIIGTDVDGVLTADPRLVPDARTVPEISYREVAELAYFGAKVLHPKTLRAVMQAGIPVWIRNSFAPEQAGTKITPRGRTIGGDMKALTTIRDVALIAVGGPGIVGLRDVVGRAFSTTAQVRASVLLISQSSPQNDICFIVGATDAKRTVDALHMEFAQDVTHEKVKHITVDPTIAIVAIVGENMRGIPGIAGRTFSAVGRENVNILAIAQGSSESNISFVVAEKDVKAALEATHREFGLGGPGSQEQTVVGS